MLGLVIVFAKVSSIQYLVWLIPLGLLPSLVHGRSATMMLFIGALMLAQIGYPVASVAAESLEPWLYVILLGRQVLLFAWVVYVFHQESSWVGGLQQA